MKLPVSLEDAASMSDAREWLTVSRAAFGDADPFDRATMVAQVRRSFGCRLTISADAAMVVRRRSPGARTRTTRSSMRARSAMCAASRSPRRSRRMCTCSPRPRRASACRVVHPRENFVENCIIVCLVIDFRRSFPDLRSRRSQLASASARSALVSTRIDGGRVRSWRRRGHPKNLGDHGPPRVPGFDAACAAKKSEVTRLVSHATSLKV